jgi:hypothetical protein
MTMSVINQDYSGDINIIRPHDAVVAEQDPLATCRWTIVSEPDGAG